MRQLFAGDPASWRGRKTNPPLPRHLNKDARSHCGSRDIGCCAVQCSADRHCDGHGDASIVGFLCESRQLAGPLQSAAAAMSPAVTPLRTSHEVLLAPVSSPRITPPAIFPNLIDTRTPLSPRRVILVTHGHLPSCLEPYPQPLV